MSTIGAPRRRHDQRFLRSGAEGVAQCSIAVYYVNGNPVGGHKINVHLQVEHITKKENAGQSYFIFTLTFVFPDLGVINLNGWRYFPSTGTLGAPSINKGKRHITTQWIAGRLFDQTLEQVKTYLISIGLCGEPYETPEQRKAILEGRNA